jgi:hypothetical protein
MKMFWLYDVSRLWRDWLCSKILYSYVQQTNTEPVTHLENAQSF